MTPRTLGHLSPFAAAAHEVAEKVIACATLATEPGSNLRAAGARRVAFVRGQQAARPSRPRKLRPATPDRYRWEL